MNTDLSVAPEIALLAAPRLPAQTDAPAPRTDGRLAGDLADLAAAPQRWWDLVRFDAGGPLRIPVPGPPGAWLLVAPPGATAECDCGQATALAGEAVETSGAGADRPPAPPRPRPGARRARPAPPAHRRPRVFGHPPCHSRNGPLGKLKGFLSRTDRALRASLSEFSAPARHPARGDSAQRITHNHHPGRRARPAPVGHNGDRHNP